MFVLLSILLGITLNSVYAATSCSSQSYLTLYNNNPSNASVGVDNVSLSAYFSRFEYNNQSAQCVLVGIPNGNISFYLTSTVYTSRYFNTLLDIGSAYSNSSGYATISYNSSLIGVDSLTAVARWYGNASQTAIQSNNKTVTLVAPVASINTTCSGSCGNTTVGGQFTLTSRLCVGRPPFSWQTCEYLQSQKLDSYARDTYIGTIITNSTGGGSVTFNTVLLLPGVYDLYSKWKGGIKYANVNASSAAANLDLNLYAAAKTTATTTAATSTVTNSSSQSSGSQSNQNQNSNFIYIAIIIVLLILISVLFYFFEHKK